MPAGLPTEQKMVSHGTRRVLFSLAGGVLIAVVGDYIMLKSRMVGRGEMESYIQQQFLTRERYLESRLSRIEAMAADIKLEQAQLDEELREIKEALKHPSKGR